MAQIIKLTLLHGDENKLGNIQIKFITYSAVLHQKDVQHTFNRSKDKWQVE